MAKHYMVNVCGENVIIVAPADATIKQIKKRAMEKYFDIYPSKLSKVVELTAPCQWDGECPEGATNCFVCASIMANE